MKVFRYILEEDNPIIIPISDTHIGDELFNEKALIAYLEKADYLILNGDIMNTATKNSVSFGYGSSPQVDLDKAVEIFKPYAHKILAVVEGNHEYRVSKEVGISLTQMFCLSLNIIDKYAGTSAYLFLNVGSKKVNYKVYATHGYGGGRTTGAKANILVQLASVVDADVYIISHTHQPLAFPQDYIRPNLRKYTLQPVIQWFINTGAFLNYGGYGERFNFKASSILTPYFILSGVSHNTTVIEQRL